MIFHSAHRNLPALDSVAALATGSELAAVQVGMAIRALMPHIGKNLLGVAGDARDIGVHASERITRLGVVIELGTRTDRSPSGCSVAATAGNLQWTVRIFRLAGRLRGYNSGAQAQGRNEKPC